MSRPGLYDVKVLVCNHPVVTYLGPMAVCIRDELVRNEKARLRAYGGGCAPSERAREVTVWDYPGSNGTAGRV